MSIVNDALKKASKEFEFRDQGVAGPVRRSQPRPSKKWVAITAMSVVIIASIFGSAALYRNMSGMSSDYRTEKPVSAIQAALTDIEQKTAAKAMRSQDVAKLNGIVYGSEGSWAIVNNKIVKEGDKLLGGEITSITKDLVRIEKKDGSELTLSLK